MLVIGVLLSSLALGPADGGEARTDFRPDLFRTLINPACSHCVDEARRKAGELRDDDRVLAWVRGKYDGGAIPFRWFLVPYRVISDTYGVFVYDADAGFVRGYPASLDYRFHGWRNGVMVMRHQDGTLFDCLTGEAFDGPHKGEHLTPIATIETNWGPWLKSSPGTVAYQMLPKYQPQALPRVVSSESSRTRLAPDRRLDPEERVLGLSLGESSDAWPLRSFGDRDTVRHVQVGGRSVTLLWDGQTGTAVAYAPETEGTPQRTITLAIDGAGSAGSEVPWFDKETGSRWSIAGRAVSGPLKGKTLKWLPGVMVKWYAWSASYPRTAIAGSPAAVHTSTRD